MTDLSGDETVALWGVESGLNIINVTKLSNFSPQLLLKTSIIAMLEFLGEAEDFVSDRTGIYVMMPITGRHAGQPGPMLYAVAVWVFLCACILPAEANQVQPELQNHRIMLLHSYHPVFWTDEISRGIKSILGDHPYTDFKVEYMDTKTLNREDYYVQLLSIYQQKYQQVKFDVIIAADDNAYRFARIHQESLFKNSPIVFCGVSEFSPSQIEGKPITGVLENEPFEDTVELALKLLPDTHIIYAIADKSSTATINLKRFRAFMDLKYPQLEQRVIQDVTKDQLKQQLTQIPDDGIVLYIGWWKDSAGKLTSLNDLFSYIRQANRPVFSVSEWTTRQGSVGGRCNRGYQQGRIAGKLALQILEGADPQSIPVLTETEEAYGYMFNYNQLVKFGIDLDLLPEDATIFYRPARQIYSIPKEMLWVLLGLLTGLTLVVIGLLWFLHYHRAVNITLHEQEKRFRNLVEATSDWIWETDAQFQCTYNSPQVEDILGYSPEDMRMSKPFDYMSDDETRRVTEILDQKMQDKEPFLHLQAVLKHKNGYPVIIECNGVPIINDYDEIVGFRGVNRDITERQKTLAQLDSILRSVPVGVSVLKNRQIQKVNQRFCDITGYSEQELIGQSTRVLYQTDLDFEDTGNRIYPDIHQKGTAATETTIVRKDGVSVDILISGTPIDPDDLDKGITFTILDITDRKRAEKAMVKRIVALTQPLDSPGNLTFEELFDLDEIQHLQDLFAESTGVASIITQVDGTPITRPSNFCRLCSQIIRQTDAGRANCYRSDAILGRRHDGGPVIQPCLSGGLWDAGASITVGGKHIANWLIGQVRDETQTDEKMLEYARQIGADEQEFLKAFREVPTMSRQQFERVSETLYELAKQLSDTAYQNVQQARFITQRKQAEEKLAQRLKMEHLLSDISGGFVGLPIEQTFEQLNRSLEMIAEDMGLERLRLVLLTPDQSRMYFSESYYIANDEPLVIDSDDLDRDMPEYAEMIRNKEIIWLSDLPDDLPDDSSLRQLCLDKGIISHLSIPMTVGQTHIGALSVTHTHHRIHFDQDMMNYLRLIADILANAVVRYRTQQALAESEQQFRSIIESSPLGIHTYELMSDGRLILIGTNAAAGDVLGIDVGLQVGLTINEAYPELEKSGLPDVYRRIAKEGGTYHGNNFEYHDEKVHGYYEFDVFQTAPNKLAVMFMDVTERIKTQRALMFNQFAVENAGEQAFWMDSVGHINYVNEQACRTLGYRGDELQSMTIFDVDPVYTRQQWNEFVQQKQSGKFETYHRNKQGQVYPVEVTANTLEYEGQTYVCAFAHDISDRRQYQDAIGDFLRTVSTETGAKMFEKFTLMMAQHLHSDIAIIGRLSPDKPDTVQTLSACRDGQIIENFEYCLKGTPCEQTIREEKSFCMFSDHVAEKFPNARFLKEFGIKGYIGMLLTDWHGKPLGIILALFRRPLENTVFSESILRVYANQTVLEMQRLQRAAEREQLMERLTAQNIELEQVTAMLETSLEQSPAGILIADAPDVRIRFANPAALLVRGDTDRDLADISYEQYSANWQTYRADGSPYPPEELPLSRAILNGEVTRNEEVIIQKEDGSRRWISANAAPIRNAEGQIEAGIVIYYDVTEQKMAEDALKESEAKHRLLFTGANDTIFIMDDQRYLECNSKALEIFGCSNYSELIGKTPVDFSPMYQEDGRLSSEKAKELLTLAFEGKPQRFPWVHRRKDGTLFYVEMSLARLELFNQTLVQAIVRDVTEHRLAEQAREKLMKELQSKNEELESIVFIASHDLRSPLVNIRGFTGELEKSLELLKELLQDVEFSDKAKKRLEYLFNVDVPESMDFIKMGSQKMDTLLNGLLRLSRIGTAQIHPDKLNVDAMFKGIVSTFKFQMMKKNVTIEVAENLHDCLGDHVLINQVFTNLIDNAIKYRSPDRPAVIKISSQQVDNQIEYAVADNGIGIAKEHLSKVFDIFHQLDPTSDKSGEGLGLTIVRRILDRQDGQVRIKSKPDAGTTVYVRLPKV